MADRELTELTEETSPTNTGLLYMVATPETTPTDKKITWTTVKAFLKTYFDGFYALIGHNHSGVYAPVLGVDDNYVTDAEKTVIANTSGTNTGDQDLSVLVTKATYHAHTVLYATTDNTPAALTVTEQTVVGRATGGNITAIAIDADLSSVSANDDTIPSAKATKAALDLKAPSASPTFTGTVTLPTVQLGEASMQLDPALSADGKWSGITETGTSGETLVFGELVYFKAADSKWWKTDANADATSGAVKIGMCVLAASGSAATEILLYGKINAASLFPALTVGAPAYIAESGGAIVVAQPTTADVIIRKVGFGNTGDELFFNPSNDYIVHT